MSNPEKGKEEYIFRRFSDFEWLHKGLLTYNPGCRIPDLPEKSVWTNVAVDSSQILEKRKRELEDLLKYVNDHPHLRMNPNFIIFLSNQELPKEEKNQNNIYIKFATYFKDFFSSQKLSRDFNKSDKNTELLKEKENLERLLKATSDLFINMQNFIDLEKKKKENLKNIIEMGRNPQSFDLVFNVNNSISEVNNKEKTLPVIKSINDVYEQITNFIDTIESSLLDPLKVR